jgi:2-phospho-L-lactate guanylyltransferase
MPGREATLWALLPVKVLAASKQRLDLNLGRNRSGLARAMLHDLLQALSESTEISRIAIVTADEDVKSIGRELGGLIIDEDHPGDLNAAVAMGIFAIRQHGGDQVAIFPADIPLATGLEIDRLVQEVRASRERADTELVGICPSWDGDGTNFLMFNAGLDFPFNYGPGSFAKHRQAAVDVPASVMTLASPPISLDIDDRSGLDEFIEYCQSHPECRNTATWRFLQTHGYIESAEMLEKTR